MQLKKYEVVICINQPIMYQIGKEVYKPATRREKFINDMRITKNDIHDVKTISIMQIGS